MKDKHLIVVSVDALVFEDLEFAKTLPMFNKILTEGSLIERVKTIYPSLTHPVHATIMTGCSAGVTGIVSNEVFESGKNERPWNNWLRQVKCETIFHAAKKAGLTTCACRWPLTAGGGDVIDYLVPEVLKPDMQGYEDNPVEAYRNVGCGENIIDIVESALEKYGYENNHPDYDEFEIYCAEQIIKRYKPNVLFTHPGYVDAERHRTGLFSDEVKESIRVTDGWLKMLWDAVCDAGIEDKTDFVILSDHGHLSISRYVSPNVFLKDAGFIKLDENGEITSWDAYATGGGLMSLVYLSNPEVSEKVYDTLSDMAAAKIYGFERVFTKEEVKELYDLDGGFSFVLETDGYSGFVENCTGDAVTVIERENPKQGASSHGHLPNKGPQPVFIGMGPSFKKGIVIPNGDMLDHAPTFAKILGVELKSAQGKVKEEILKK